MVHLTPRDMTTLTVLAEHYGAPVDLVAEMLGVSQWRAYEIVRRWRAAHMVSDIRTRPVPGPHWVFPTRSAAEVLLGFPVQPWKPTPRMAAHNIAVLQARLALAGMDLDGWVSERHLRSEVGPVKRGERRPHVHDGRFIDHEGQMWAIEVELTEKSPVNAHAAVLAAYSAAEAAGCHGLRYLCRGEQVRATIRTIAQAAADIDPHRFHQAGPKFMISDLDALIAPGVSPAGSRRGIRLLQGGGAADDDQQAAQ